MRDIIELYKKQILAFLGTLNIVKGSIINKDNQIDETEKQFLKEKMIQICSNNVNIEALEIAIDELTPYLYQQ